MPKVITKETLDEYILYIKKHLPGFEIRFKDQSRFQRFIGWLLKPFNPRYMSGYITTMFGKVYFPSQEFFDSRLPSSNYRVLRHEFIHLMDAKRFPFWFELSYLFLLPAVFTMRSYWELRGYTQDLLCTYEEFETIPDASLDWITAQFTGPWYLWMWPFKKKVREALVEIKEKILRGEIKGPYPYKDLE